ncbi:MAG: S1 RNA-binding domain-containing protein [Lachnospiraceae bacterium]|nr:S1 RNA-binding domain-containing protein [Lachnospiraceae bacterium]
MIQLGKTQDLIIIKTTEFGVYLSERLDKNAEDRVLLPKNQIPAKAKIGDFLTVFVYKDSEDRLIATTAKPLLELDGLALLTVKEVTSIGAFLEWGLAKDLLLPFKEQQVRVKAGEQVLVTLYIDKTNRLCATTKLYGKLATRSPYQKDDKVTGYIYEITEPFGAFVAVDNKYSALIPTREMSRPLRLGEIVECRVIRVQEDGKLDLSLRDKTWVQIDSDCEFVLEELKKAGGFLPYHDKSDADEIKRRFRMSKNAFKRTIGHLYKNGSILIEEEGIRLK